MQQCLPDRHGYVRQSGVGAIRVRPARPDDAEAIVRVRIAAWQAAYRGLMPDGHLDAMGDGRERVDGNARARRFYERAGWRCDGGTKLDDDFGTGVTEVRYRRELPVSAE